MRRILLLLIMVIAGVFTVIAVSIIATEGPVRGFATFRSIGVATYHLVIPPERERYTRSLNRADVEREVRRALARGDFRLVGIGGVGLFFPGLEKNCAAVDQAVQRHGYRFIEGTSDYIDSEEQARLQEAAYEYAKQYNLRLWPHVPK